MRKGIVFVVSGPSGAGKGTVAKGMVDSLENIRFSVSATNRAPRVGEIDGVSYYFVTDERFDEMIRQGEFLEYVDKYKNKYGTPKSSVVELIEKGVDVILDIETIGAENVKKAIPEAVTIFILPPSLEILKNRLIARGTETEESVKTRFSQACDEISVARDYDYIVVNDDKDECLKTVASIIEAERNKGFRNIDLPQRVLNRETVANKK